MGGIYFSFGVGRAGASGANASYILRDTATERNGEAIFARNYPEHGQEGDSYKAQKDNLVEYARQQEEDELKRPKKGKGEARTHYRGVASFEGKVDTEKARDMGKEYLENRFPDARALAVVHQDTKHTHIHFHVQARDINDKTLRFNNNEWKEIDKEWNKIYAREFGKDKEVEHLSKKAETKEWKQSLIKGESKEKPERVNTTNKEVYRERDRRNAGVYELNKERDGRDKPSLADESKGIEQAARNIIERQSGVNAGKRAVNELVDKSQRANEQSNRTESGARDLSVRVEQLRGQVKELSKEQDRESPNR